MEYMVFFYIIENLFMTEQYVLGLGFCFNFVDKLEY